VSISMRQNALLCLSLQRTIGPLAGFHIRAARSALTTASSGEPPPQHPNLHHTGCRKHPELHALSGRWGGLEKSNHCRASTLDRVGFLLKTLAIGIEDVAVPRPACHLSPVPPRPATQWRNGMWMPCRSGRKSSTETAARATAVAVSSFISSSELRRDDRLTKMPDFMEIPIRLERLWERTEVYGGWHNNGNGGDNAAPIELEAPAIWAETSCYDGLRDPSQPLGQTTV